LGGPARSSPLAAGAACLGGRGAAGSRAALPGFQKATALAAGGSRSVLVEVAATALGLRHLPPDVNPAAEPTVARPRRIS